MHRFLSALAALILLPQLAGCSSSGPTSGSASGPSSKAVPDLVLLSGSENKSLEPILHEFERKSSSRLRIEYLGSVDTMLRLESGAAGADAVWPANSLWIDLGDRQHLVKKSASIMRSPVVLGVKKSVADRLGWIGHDVDVKQIVEAAGAHRLRLMMTSATQSNSGACAYLGYLSALSGSPEVLSRKHLDRPALRSGVRKLLASVDRSSGSSGWLKELFLQRYDRFDAMVNYEAVLIETNQELVAQGKEPLYAIYPRDGLTIADSPLGYVDHGNESKARLFQQLQDYLLSPDVQKQIQATGRRVGLAGLDTSGGDPNVFKPNWGIRLDRVLNPIRMPQAPVIREALDLYQTALRKPSLTAFCVDCSGSMEGKGITSVRQSLHLLLDQDQSRQYLLQAAPDDKNLVIPFNHSILGEWSASGNKPDALQGLLQQVDGMRADGATDIYSPVMRALDRLRTDPRRATSFPAVILMTDGMSNRGPGLADLKRYLVEHTDADDIPVFAIMFGDASPEQLQQIADATSGRVFDGRTDLVRAFREARGYN